MSQLKFFFYFGMLSLFCTYSYAQAVIPLDSVKLSGSKKSQEGSSSNSKIKDCLLNSEGCSHEYKIGAEITMDEVLKFELIDRDKLDAEVGSASSSESTVFHTPLPSVDMEILFDYNSYFIRPDQKQRLIELGDTLSSSEFNNFHFLFFGHTDAKGSATYNQNLSDQRAQSVANFVSLFTNVPSGRVGARGLGFTKLKDENDRYGAQNRRVQLVLVPLKK